MTDLIAKAYEIAKLAHQGQKDQGGKAYILHPVAVAELVHSEKEKIVALLHDVVEDTPTTLDELRPFFDEEIIQAVDAMTKREKTESFIDYLKRCKANPIARVVKIADMIHNSDNTRLRRKPNEADTQRQEKYQVGIEFLRMK